MMAVSAIFFYGEQELPAIPCCLFVGSSQGEEVDSQGGNHALENFPTEVAPKCP